MNVLMVSASGLIKTGTGTLATRDFVTGLTLVLEGILTSTTTHDGLVLGSSAELNLSSAGGAGMTVTGDVMLSGIVRAAISSQNTILLDAPDGELTISGASLQLTADEAIGASGEFSKTIVRARQRASVFSTIPVPVPQQNGQGSGHLGHGVFFRNVRYVDVDQSSEVILDLYQAAPGDSDGDGDFDQNDIILVLQANKYFSGQSATWTEGDWNQDGLFDQFDIIEAQQTGSYLQNANAALRELFPVTGPTPEATMPLGKDEAIRSTKTNPHLQAVAPLNSALAGQSASADSSKSNAAAIGLAKRDVPADMQEKLFDIVFATIPRK